MTRRFLFVPVVNHMDLLETAVRSVAPGLFDDYLIFNNSGAPIPERVYAGTPFRVWTPERRRTFRETQNDMRAHAIAGGYDYYAFMHNDGEVVAGSGADRRLVDYTDGLVCDGAVWGAVFTHYDVLCTFSTRAAAAIGPWGDPAWPADQQSGYYLDNDYYYRMRVEGYPHHDLGAEGVLHRESSNTIRDAGERNAWYAQRGRVVQHYQNKWGGQPGGEAFRVAFNAR